MSVARDVLTARAHVRDEPLRSSDTAQRNARALPITRHVIADGGTFRITAFGNGQTYPAALIGAGPARDLALMQIQTPASLRGAAMGDSDRVRVGDRV